MSQTLLEAEILLGNDTRILRYVFGRTAALTMQLPACRFPEPEIAVAHDVPPAEILGLRMIVRKALSPHSAMDGK